MTLMNAPGRLLVGPVVLLVSFSSSYDTVSDIDVDIYSG